MESIQHLLTSYGYVALYGLLMLGIVGLPVPDETLLVFSGYLIARGTFGAPQTVAAAFAGSVTGITISYLLGRTLGIRVVLRYGKYLHITEQRLYGVNRWFDRIGHWALMIGYYIPGVRHFTAVVAGTTGLRPFQFAIYAYSGALIWVSTFLGIGYAFGEKWEQMAELVHGYVLEATIVAAVIAGVYLLVRWRRRSGG